MKNQVNQLCLRTVLVCMALACASSTEAQQRLHGGGGSSAQVQYAPGDPQTRSRLFNFQTGHRGAFYNCDGEEDKRNSPYIFWEYGPADAKLHNPLLDIINWRDDKREIAQRICDGAGACCNGGSCQSGHPTVIASPETCGCSHCVAKSAAGNSSANFPIVRNEGPVSLLQRAYGKSKVTSRSRAAVQTSENVAGLVARKQAPSARPTQRPVARSTRSSVAQSVQQTVKQEQCDCATCRAQRKNPAARSGLATTKAPSDKPVAVSRSASLLDRARSSRKAR